MGSCPEEALRLSKSKILNLLGEKGCQWKYKLKYIDQIEEPDTPFIIYAEAGKIFHSCVEKFFNEEDPLLETGENKEYDEMKYIAETKAIFWDNFITHFVKGYIPEHLKFKPFLQESKIYDPEFNVSAIADAIFYNNNEGMTLIDWKSGKPKPKKEMRFELAFYTFFYNRNKTLLPRPINEWGIFFAKNGKLFVEPVDKDIMASIPSVIAKARKIISNGCFKKNPKSCYFCGYRQAGICGGI